MIRRSLREWAYLDVAEDGGDDVVSRAAADSLIATARALRIGGADGEAILSSYHKLQDELKRFSPVLSQKPQILVATKADDPQSQKNIDVLQASMTELNPAFFLISSLTGEGIQPLLWKIKEGLPKEGPSEEEQITMLYRQRET